MDNRQQFLAQTQAFHQAGSHWLLKDVLPAFAPDIAAHLAIFTNAPSHPLPFIPLVEAETLQFSSVLQGALTAPEQLHQPAFINWLRNDLHKRVYNNATFTARALTNNQLQVGLGDYFGNLSTSDIHYYNLIRHCPPVDTLSVADSLELPSFRAALDNWAATLRRILTQHDFSHYCASLACSVMTVLRCDDGRYRYLMQQNAVAKGTAALDLHVTPSFMLQPFTAQPDITEFQPETFVFKEFGEELLGLTEYEHFTDVNQLRAHLHSHPLLSQLMDDIQHGKAWLKQTGMVLDLYRLRPELTWVLVIDDPQYSKALQPCWEAEQGQPMLFVDLEDEQAFNDLMVGVPQPVCGPGLAALWQGRAVAQQRLSNA